MRCNISEYKAALALVPSITDTEAQLMAKRLQRQYVSALRQAAIRARHRSEKARRRAQTSPRRAGENRAQHRARVKRERRG